MKEPLVTIKLSEYEQLKDFRNQFPLKENLIARYETRQTILNNVNENIGYIDKTALIALIENLYDIKFDDINLLN